MKRFKDVMNLIRIMFQVSLCLFLSLNVTAANPTAYDIDMAKEICNERPLDLLEGIWIYPEDEVTVLILRNTPASSSASDTYDITFIEGFDCSLSPGEKIGKLTATPQNNTYEIELFTEKKNNLLLRPMACLANLTNDNETLIIKKSKSKLKFRLNLNFNRLLPGFWKIVSSGITSNPNSGNPEPPVGMVKIYPSYDGNGSSKRQPRYL